MCNCIQQMDELLKDRNTQIVATLSWSKDKPSKVAIMTMKADDKKRGKPANVIATFCPFCGERYEALKARGVEVEGGDDE